MKLKCTPDVVSKYTKYIFNIKLPRVFLKHYFQKNDYSEHFKQFWRNGTRHNSTDSAPTSNRRRAADLPEVSRLHIQMYTLHHVLNEALRKSGSSYHTYYNFSSKARYPDSCGASGWSRSYRQNTWSNNRNAHKIRTWDQVSWKG